jgi:hypothetical protein
MACRRRIANAAVLVSVVGSTAHLRKREEACTTVSRAQTGGSRARRALGGLRPGDELG